MCTITQHPQVEDCHELTDFIEPVQSGAGYNYLAHYRMSGLDVQREEERWTESGERLLVEWAKNWHAQCDKHETARLWWKRLHYAISIPSILLPLVISGIWGKLPSSEGATVATSTMAVSGALSALSTLLQAESQSERHLHAVHRYLDLISDVEETLCKEPMFRPDADITILSFKMRSDTLLRLCPAVSAKAPPDSDSDDEWEV